MKKIVFFIFVLFILFITYFLFIKKSKVLVCNIKEPKIGGDIQEKVRFYKANGLMIMETFIVFFGNEDNYTENYYNYISKIKECSNLKRNDNVIEYRCKYNVNDLKDFKEVFKDKDISYKKIKKYYEEMHYSCFMEEK